MPRPIDSQSELIDRLQKGELSAFKTVYGVYWKQLYIHAYRRVESSELAEELTQDLFVQLWERREYLSIEKSLKAYLYGMLKKKILLHFREQYTRQNNYKEYGNTIQLYVDSSLERRIVQRNLIEKIDQLILNLPSRTRHVFELSRKHFLTNKEIAVRLDISDKTVEYHINYALKFLREHCSEYTTMQVLFVILFL